MYAIEFWVGPRRGSWIRAAKRWPNFELAKAEAAYQSQSERNYGLSAMMKRVVAV